MSATPRLFHYPITTTTRESSEHPLIRVAYITTSHCAHLQSQCRDTEAQSSAWTSQVHMLQQKCASADVHASTVADSE
jgi:hypothetical protein